jgi:uncharacterized protein YaaQ
MLLSFAGLTKVLITTGVGLDDKGSVNIEIIDLNDPSKVCQPSADYEYPIDKITGASGCLLKKNNIALICGGIRYRTRLDDCFAIIDNAIRATTKLTQPRSHAASVALNGNILWMTGGYLDGSVPTNSTEFVQLSGTRPGPDLPLELQKHCLVSLNETTVLLIGGELADWTWSKATFYCNHNHQTWSEGPSLITARTSHSCALFKSPLHGHTDTVIVTGGYKGDWLDSTEFLNLDTGDSWTLG